MPDPVPTVPATTVQGAPRCVLAESPRWHEGRWWWVDASNGRLFSSCPGPGQWHVDTWLDLGGRMPMVHPAGPGRLVVAHGSVLQFYDAEAPGRASPVLAELKLPQGWGLNDGAAGPDGGLWIGAVHPTRDPESGYLQQVRADGRLGGRIEGIGLSNGIAADPTGSVLYHADSVGRVVFAHRLNSDGDITDSTVHLRFGTHDGMPDGLATDMDGGLWVAMYGPGEVRRYRPDGERDLVISVPTPQVTSVALGGPDGRDVLITTAREKYDEARSAAEPMAGRLFTARSPHVGRPVFSVRFEVE